MDKLPNILSRKRFFFYPPLIILTFVVFIILSRQLSFAQEGCYIYVSSEQLLNGTCGPIQTSGPCAGQYQCTGTRQPNGQGETCTACVAPPGQEKLSCLRDTGPPSFTSCESLGYTIDTTSCPQGGGQPTKCTGVYPDGCGYCVTPVCTVGNCYDGSPADANDITCAPCGTQTLAQINGQESLSITLDSVNGTTYGGGQNAISVSGLTVPSYSTFSSSNAIPNTSLRLTGNNGWFSEIQCNNAQSCSVDVPGQGTYALTALFPQQTVNNLTYPSSSDTASLIVWTPGQQPTQTTCSLSADPQSLNMGGSSTWTLTSSNAPSGSTAWWNGTVSGPISLWTPNSTYRETVFYNNSGSDSRWVDIKNSSGTALCTTDTVQVYVNPNNCSALSITPSSLNLTIGGTGSLTAQGINGTISSWSSDSTSIASVTSFGNPTTVRGVSSGTTRVRVRDSGQGNCAAETVYVPVSVSTSTSDPACPGGVGACANSNGGGITASCSGTWGWSGSDPTYQSQSTQLDSWCSGQTSGARPYCYICGTTTPGGTPTPTPGVISGGFQATGVSVSGPLLVGRMLQDFNNNFRIDEGVDTLVSKLTSLVSGTARTLSGTRDIVGAFMNVLGHASAVYKYILPGAGVPATQTVSYTGASGSTSNFVKTVNYRKCTIINRDGQKIEDTNCNYYPDRTYQIERWFTDTSIPSENATKRKHTTGWWSPYISGASFRHIISYTLTNVEAGSCASGCTAATGVTFDGATADRRCYWEGSVDNGGLVCSVSYPPEAQYEVNKNPDGTCFFESFREGNDTGWRILDSRCSGNTCEAQNYTETTPPQRYENCTKYTYQKNRTSTTPWSVSFASPTITSANSLATGDWYNLFNIVSPEGCYLDPNTNKDTVSPASAGQYCTCQVWESGGGYYSTFNCTYPLKTGQTFGGAPPGDYIFSVAASGTTQIRYRVTAGSSTLAQGDGSISGGTLTFNFTVPDSAIGQTVNVELSQKGGGQETVTFGAPGLYPKGWYEANVVFGLGREAYLKGRVVDPPDDYPYTIGQVPPAGNYCSRTANIEQCWNSLAESNLFYNKINQVDYLLADLKAGGWFQVKDADLHALGNLISYIPSSCKLPGCTPQFDLVGTGGFPGIPAYTGTAGFGSGTVSGKGWLANSGYSGRRYDYNYFKSLLGSVGGVVDLRTAGRGTIAGDTLTLDRNDLGYIASSSGTGFARFDGNLVLVDSSGGGNVNLENKRLVIFTDGDVLIRLRINLTDEEGFFGLFSGGSIVIDPGVKSENPNQYGLEGVFLANGTIATGTDNPISGSGTADEQLYVRGMLAAWGGVQLQRDLDPSKQTGANNTKPAETIEYAPDLVLNFPKELLRQGSVWREVAP